MEKHQRESVELARLIAKELGDGWEADPPPDDDGMVWRDMHGLHDADGNELALELYEGGQRVELRSFRLREVWDHYAYDDEKNWPSKATVAVSRGPRPMARAFEKMIPKVREFNARARQRKAESEAQSRADHALAVQLAEILGDRTDLALYDTHGKQEMLTRFHASRYPHSFEVSHGRVKVELYSIPPEVARRVAQVLAEPQ